jgi:cyclohexyl-isocyanide hydratase
MSEGLHIGFIIFPDITQLDFTGPLQVLHRLPGAKMHIIAKTMNPVPSDCGLSLVPTVTFADCRKLDVICVPGGMGTVAAIQDTETVDFVRKVAGEVKYLTSVCTGVFILGAAGLLEGKRVTTHWAYTDLLEMVGAIYEPGRVVRDGNVFTGGGVTAGIDFAFTLVTEIAGKKTAEAIQLAMEYDPAPPVTAGHPDIAPEKLTKMLRQRVYTESVGSLAQALVRKT